jgi:ATP-dependent helicase/nuclease subunit A
MQSGGAAEVTVAGDHGPIHRIEFGNWPPDGTVRDIEVKSEVALEAWVSSPAPRREGAERALSPSDLGGAKVVFGIGTGLGEVDAKQRGTVIHSLVERLFPLPEVDWEAEAQRILAEYSGDREDVLGEALRVVRSPKLMDYRNGKALAEVEFTARLEELGGALVNGTIDLLLIEKNRVRILDFKSNAVVPINESDVPLGILRQMGTYRAAIKQIYPSLEVVCEIYWTASNDLMLLTCAGVDAAMRSATAS